ncbi:MAG TPA: lysylphosphatidylglycerol synthase transmembrane domain-containing protein [Candidatus Limnocylindrales bacterium]|nr:lysylphosphatidylglycerol synthase transmembrane domain-containing protein [Candidatus Limnocylindrales bacterium]
MSRRTAGRAILGIAISVAAVVILVRSVDIGAALEVLSRADLGAVAVMAVSVLLDVAARGARWRALLIPIRRIPYRRVLGYTYVGYLANNVLPARLGELVRSHALGEGEGLSRTTVLGTVVVERIVDTVIVVALAAVAVVLLGVGGIISTAVVLGAAFVGILLIGLVLAVVSHRLPGADRVTAMVERFPLALDLGRRLRDGLAVISRPGTVAAALAYSALAWTFSIMTFVIGGRAIGVELTAVQGALLSSGVALATIVPSGPGYLGTFELTAVGIATQFGVGANEAFAIALLVHAMILIVTSAGGAIAALRLRVGLSTGSRDRPDAGSEVA